MNPLSILIISMFLSSCLGNSSLDTSKVSTLDDTTSSNTKNISARIKTVHGDIIFKFYSKEAPNTSKRIQELITNGFSALYALSVLMILLHLIIWKMKFDFM